MTHTKPVARGGDGIRKLVYDDITKIMDIVFTDGSAWRYSRVEMETYYGFSAGVNVLACARRKLHGQHSLEVFGPGEYPDSEEFQLNVLRNALDRNRTAPRPEPSPIEER